LSLPHGEVGAGRGVPNRSRTKKEGISERGGAKYILGFSRCFQKEAKSTRGSEGKTESFSEGVGNEAGGKAVPIDPAYGGTHSKRRGRKKTLVALRENKGEVETAIME